MEKNFKLDLYDSIIPNTMFHQYIFIAFILVMIVNIVAIYIYKKENKEFYFLLSINIILSINIFLFTYISKYFINYVGYSGFEEYYKPLIIFKIISVIIIIINIITYNLNRKKR